MSGPSHSELDEYEIEPVRGLPERPPAGEDVLWQGRPSTFALARDAFKITWIAGYFGVFAIWQAVEHAHGPAKALAVMLPYLVIGLVVCALLCAMAAARARTTIYTVTSARVAMRVGAALTVTLNIPFRQVANANLALQPNGTGTIALETLGDTRISYLTCWPHVRPWHFARTQPALRCIPDAARVAKMLAEAAETRLNEPRVSRDPGRMAVAAE